MQVCAQSARCKQKKERKDTVLVIGVWQEGSGRESKEGQRQPAVNALRSVTRGALEWRRRAKWRAGGVHDN